MMRGGRSFSGNERNCFFLNTGAAPAAAGRFANISAVSGLDYPDDGRAVALVDWDHDGDLDMWISNRNAPRLRLMRNDVPRKNHFVALRLQGNGESTNRDAVGARVELVLDNSKSGSSHPKSIKTLRAGEGFLAQSSKWLYFGLGEADAIEKVTVRWPGGDIEQFDGIKVDGRYRLVQGSRTAQAATALARKTNLIPSSQKVADTTQQARIPTVNPLRLPVSTYTATDGIQHDVQAEEGRLLLLNFWASWCAPCLTELKEFADRHEELEAAGIDILALAVDGLGRDASPTAVENALRLAEDREFPFAVGQANSQLIADLQDIHNLLVPLQQGEQLPLPSSFLIDTEGRVVMVYKGAVSVDQLLKDSTHIDAERVERFIRSAPLGGQPIRHAQVERTAAITAGFRRFLLADHLQQSDRTAEAARQYSDALKFWPESFWVHNNLGGALQRLGRHDEAIAQFREALRIRPKNAMVYRNLAMALQAQGKSEEAIEQYHKALLIKPDDGKTHMKLGAILQRHGRTTEAIVQYRLAARTDPTSWQAHANLGTALNMINEFKEATTHLLQAVRINPENAKALTSLGVALEAQGDAEGAVNQYKRAIELDSDPMALNNLARIRATHPDAKMRDGAKAIELAKRCCRQTGHRTATPLDTLAAAYAEAGRFEDAVKWQTKAIELARATRKNEFSARRKLYEAGKPYRSKPGED